MKNFLYIWFYNIQNAVIKINTELTNEFCRWNLLQELHRPVGKLCLFQITSNRPWTLQLTYDLGTYLNVVFFALSIANVKKGGFRLKKQSWPSKSHEGQLQGKNWGHLWISCWQILQELHWPLGKLCLFQITSNWTWTLQLIYDLGTYLNVEFSTLSIADVKKGVSILKNKVDLQKAMKVTFMVKMKVTIEFLVEIYFRNDLHFFEKYFTSGNIQPSREFLDTLYILFEFAQY